MHKIKLNKMFWKRQFNKIRNIRVGKLFYNNKFVIIFSIISSLAIWIGVSSNDSDIVPVTISDIPVNIELSESAKQDGLKIFSGHNITARVEVTGNRIVVGQVTKDDIQVTAPQAAGTIMSPGNYTLELSAKKVGVLQDYNIVSAVKPSVITVMVDRYREAEFEVESNIDFTAAPGHFVGSTVLSSPKVTLSGPETEISKIKKVAVKCSVPGEVSSTISLKLPIVMYDVYGQPISSETISSSEKIIEATVPVLMKKDVDIVPSFLNFPSDIDFDKNYKDAVKVTPSKLTIAGPDYIVSSLNTIALDGIDFSTLNLANNKFTLPINLPQNCRSLSNIYSADVVVNMSNFREKNLYIKNFKFLNLPKEKSAEIYNGELCITVLAPASKIGNVKSSDIEAQVDFSGLDSCGSTEVPVKLSMINRNDAWIYGKYCVNVNIKSRI